MNYHIIPGITLLTLTSLSQAADSLCLQKEQNIQHEIDIARQHNNQRRVNGLVRALTEARAGCSDEKLRMLHQQKIKQHQQKVAERQKELDQERAKSTNARKIAKREEKLAEAKHELQEIQSAPY